MTNIDDAWKQEQDIVDRYTKLWEPRHDLRVHALGCDRSVRLALGKLRLDYPTKTALKYDWTATTRNVITMRELGTALLEACDFVEESNPTWAASMRRHRAEPLVIKNR